jgi:hypothetical protein
LETVLTRISNPRAQTGSNETPSFRQTKYCQTEQQLYEEIVSVKKKTDIDPM